MHQPIDQEPIHPPIYYEDRPLAEFGPGYKIPIHSGKNSSHDPTKGMDEGLFFGIGTAIAMFFFGGLLK
jgi:hypothetical protein